MRRPHPTPTPPFLLLPPPTLPHTHNFAIAIIRFSEGVTRSAFSAVCFVFLYVMFLFVVLLLLVNLLIAMMSSTYERERESARLQWRVLFARLVLRYELLNMPLAITDPMRHEQRVMVGDSTMGKSEYFLFRSYDKGAQLNLDGEGGDLFADGDGDGKGDEAPAAADSAEAACGRGERRLGGAVARRSKRAAKLHAPVGGSRLLCSAHSGGAPKPPLSPLPLFGFHSYHSYP